MSLREEMSQCRKLLTEAIIEALQAKRDLFESIERTPRGDIPVTGLAVELSPWTGGLGLSLRLTSEFPCGTYRYDSADWKYFDFTEGVHAPAFRKAESAITALYEIGNSEESQYDLEELAHLIFWAGAEAVMDESVSVQLQVLGIDAPKIHERFISSSFEYVVVDPDQTVKSNYCDIVLAHRVMQRLISS